jgi:uncharacterized protein with HEPN domain
MRDYALAVQRLTAGRSLPDPQRDEALRLALERAIKVIGEAANRLPPAFQRRHPRIEWSKIIGMRNVLAHGYDVIQDEVLWDTATLHVPPLLSQVTALLDSLGDGDG